MLRSDVIPKNPPDKTVICSKETDLCRLEITCNFWQPYQSHNLGNFISPFLVLFVLCESAVQWRTQHTNKIYSV